MSRSKAPALLTATLAASLVFSAQAYAAEPTWRAEIGPMIAAKCAACHGSAAPVQAEWKLLEDAKRKVVGPRMDTYHDFMNFVVWPDTGAMMRRLDDGSASGGKAGNMYQYLGDSDEERTKNLKTIKAWLGEGAWNLNRFKARGEVPGISKEQLEKIKAKY